MRRFIARGSQVFLDVVMLSAAYWLAFLLRFDWSIPASMSVRAVLLWPYAVVLQFALLTAFGVRRFAWRYVGLRETTRIFASLASGTVVFMLLRAGAIQVMDNLPIARHAALPAGVVLINLILAFLGVVGVRVTRRLIAERRKGGPIAPSRPAEPTLLIGAGEAGVMVARELANWPQLGIKPVGFVDDDTLKIGTVVYGLPVLAPTGALREVAAKTGAKQVLITIANTTGHNIRRITALCQEAGLPAKIVPGIYEIVGGKVNLSRIRSVAIQDLLGREPVVLEETTIAHAIRDQVVLITGAGGSIGKELCRQVCRFGPKKLVLLDQAETSLFYIHRELQATSDAPPLVPCIADVCDAELVQSVFAEHRPAVVLHAAAYKHVPMMEANPREAIRNNVLGTRVLADAADRFGVKSFVMISTDKAVNPTSVMGATKRLAEMYVQSLSQRSATLFVAVRFGNVLGSAGSVIPLFKEQIAQGGPVTVTHADMKRYFMTIEEACQLVLQAGAMGQGGEIFILDMGEPVKIVDLARDLIALSGLRVDEDIDIEITGLRPGEKLFEELSVAEEQADKTRHPKIYVGRIRPEPLSSITLALDSLEQVLHERPRALRTRLQKLIPEYTPHETEPQLEVVRVATS